MKGNSNKEEWGTGAAVMAAALVLASPYTVVAENKSAVNEKNNYSEYVEMKKEIWNISSGKSRMREF